MKVLIPVLLAASFSLCSTSQTSIQNHDQSSGPAGASDICAGLAAGLNVDLESGGPIAKVGDQLVFSADPRTSDGASVPSECKTGSFSAEPTDGSACTVDSGSSASAIVATTTDKGSCAVRAKLGDLQGTSKPVPIQ